LEGCMIEWWVAWLDHSNNNINIYYIHIHLESLSLRLGHTLDHTFGSICHLHGSCPLETTSPKCIRLFHKPFLHHFHFEHDLELVALHLSFALETLTTAIDHQLTLEFDQHIQKGEMQVLGGFLPPCVECALTFLAISCSFVGILW